MAVLGRVDLAVGPGLGGRRDPHLGRRLADADRWYAFSKLGGDLGDQLVFWTSPGPTGPFTATAPVATISSDPDTGEVTYMPLAHPDVLPVAGTMVVSYSRNNLDFAKVQADPTLYRPTLLRVPLPE